MPVQKSRVYLSAVVGITLSLLVTLLCLPRNW
jgi:hypothetical protein